MKRNAICLGAVTVLTVGVISTAMARPNYLTQFKAHYKTAQGKPMLNGANCTLCHVGAANSGKWNVYGDALKAALGAKGVQDPAKVVAALQAVEKKTNPSTKQTYAQLIAADKFPGSNVPAGGGAAAGPTMAAGAAAWEPVYNGVSTDGLTKVGAGNWTVQDFVLKYTGGGNGSLHSAKQYENYSAIIVVRFPQAGAGNDSGVYLRTGAGAASGPQLNLGPGDAIGSISGAQGTKARPDLFKKNDWNILQITVYNGHAALAINGTPAWEEATGLPTTPGYIGIEAAGTPIDVAQFWVTPLK